MRPQFAANSFINGGTSIFVTGAGGRKTSTETIFAAIRFRHTTIPPPGAIRAHVNLRTGSPNNAICLRETVKERQRQYTHGLS